MRVTSRTPLGRGGFRSSPGFAGATKNVTAKDGFADVEAHDQFCAGTACVVTRLFDQTPFGNHLNVLIIFVTFLVPVSAILLGWLFLDETLGAAHLIGMALIAAGLALIDGRLIGARA